MTLHSTRSNIYSFTPIEDITLGAVEEIYQWHRFRGISEVGDRANEGQTARAYSNTL